jgi:prepilin-type N-terminal cleavage/methylation domain-containing protein
MRRGFTLFELLLVVSIVALLLASALPRAGHLLDSITVEQAAQRLAAAHARARILAVVQSRVALLLIRPDSVTLRLIQGRDTTTVWTAAGPSAAGVTLTGPARTIVFSPIGMTTGVSNATYVLVRGPARRQLIISRLGRVRIVRQ